MVEETCTEPDEGTAVVTEVGLADNEKSDGAAGGVKTIETSTVRVKDPPVPDTRRVKVPTEAPALTVNVNVDGPEGTTGLESKATLETPVGAVPVQFHDKITGELEVEVVTDTVE